MINSRFQNWTLNIANSGKIVNGFLSSKRQNQSLHPFSTLFVDEIHKFCPFCHLLPFPFCLLPFAFFPALLLLPFALILSIISRSHCCGIAPEDVDRCICIGGKMKSSPDCYFTILTQEMRSKNMSHWIICSPAKERASIFWTEVFKT